MNKLSTAEREALEAAKQKAAELLFDGDEWRASFEEGFLAARDLYGPERVAELERENHDLCTERDGQKSFAMRFADEVRERTLEIKIDELCKGMLELGYIVGRNPDGIDDTVAATLLIVKKTSRKDQMMSFYKIESTYNTIQSRHPNRKKKTYKFFCKSYESMTLRLRNELLNKAKITVKEISEYEYIKGTTI